jgi:hypothetical protein
MQIHEITALNEGARWDATKQFAKSLGSAAADELENLAFGSPVTDYSKIEPESKPKDQGPTADQYSAAEKARKEKQELAAKAAQDQMAPFSKFQPAATPAAKPAPGTQMTTTTPDPEVLDPVAKRAQKYTGIDNNNVIDVDAQEVPDPAKVAKLPRSAPAQLARPAAQLPKPAAQLPRPATATNYAQTNKVGYRPATVNAPVATVPAIPGKVTTAKPAAPNINPAAAPVVYRYQGRPLNPSNPADATRIAQLQALGKTSG